MGLDTDQRAALRYFMEDVADVLQRADVNSEYFERTIGGLSGAYHAALVTRHWHVVVAVLSDTLDSVRHRLHAPEAWPSYRRLLSIVRENVDLLPPEMLELA